jgi:hypothetical protein
MIGLLINISLKVRTMTGTTRENFLKAMKGLVGYPIILMLCWLPTFCSDFIQYYFGVLVNDATLGFTGFTAVSMGWISTLYYWATDTYFTGCWANLYAAGFSWSRYAEITKEGKSRKSKGAGTSPASQTRKNRFSFGTASTKVEKRGSARYAVVTFYFTHSNNSL